MLEELLDCPFCGEKAVIGEGADHAYVTCRNCACATPVCSTVEQAIDIWNTRTTKIIGKREQITPYIKLKKSLYEVIGMTCALCKTKHCQAAQSECSGIAEAKEAIPREIEIVCLKNRYGKSRYAAQFTYYPQYDFFAPKEPGGFTRSYEPTPFDD